MRTIAWLTLGMVGCGAGGGQDRTTHGPLASIVKVSAREVRLHAVHHRLDLAELPVTSWVGLPARGTIEVDAELRLPVVDGQRRYDRAQGTIAVRCVAGCQLGDDHARLAMPDASLFGGDIAFSHLDLGLFDVELTVADGRARVSRWTLGSTDLTVDVDLEVALAPALADAALDGCVGFAPTDALAGRDRRLHTLLTLVSPVVGPDQRYRAQIAGTVASPRVLARVCGDDGAGPAPTP